MHHIGPDQAVDIPGIVTESITSDDSGHTTTIRQERSTLERGSKSTSRFAGWFTSRSSDDTNDDQDQYLDEDHIVSNVLIHVSASGTGLMNKYYYRFQNIQLNKDKITVYYNPKTFTPPTEPYWIDMISGNISIPQRPTVFVIKGDKVQGTKWFYLPIEYVSALEKQPQCTAWVDPLAYLLQVRYSYNIWHTWNEGLMGLFQTLRELGKLPLAAVGPEGRLTEITDGMGEGCPWIYNLDLKKVMQQTRCPPRDGLLETDRCNPETESWCREGAVVSVFGRNSDRGPVILPYTAASVMNVWSHLYSSMTTDVRDWSNTEGMCFKDLVIGKSSTLNFYQMVNGTEPDENALAKYPRIDNLAARVEAMAVFKAFVTSAQREWALAQAQPIEDSNTTTNNDNNTAPMSGSYAGYADPGMERLRQGIGPEDLAKGALEAMKLTAVPGMLREEMAELKRLWAKREAQVQPLMAQFIERYGTAKDMIELGELQGLVEDAEYSDDYEGIAAKYVMDKEKGELRRRRRQQRRLLVSSSSDNDDDENGLDGDIAGHVMQQPNGSLNNNNNNNNNNNYQEHHDDDGSKRSLLEQQHSKWFDKTAIYRHETPRPVVTYMSRNFFSRGVLNEKDILEYILLKYNVTVKVTTFEEPLLEVMDMLGTSDVMFGMHGAGWTNALFIKRGATTMQMFPYGWRLPDNSTVRGFNYREIVYASECPYMEWVNPIRDHAFFRRIDYPKKKSEVYSLHPDPSWPLPNTSWPGNPWIYQNTYVDMKIFSSEIDKMMTAAGIRPMTLKNP